MSTERLPIRDRRGFTLIEVMIAIIILAIGLLGLQALGLTAARSVANGEWNARATATATVYLERTLAELRAHSSGAPRPNSRCDLINDGRDRVSVAVNMNDPRLPRVTVIVRPAAGAPATRVVTLNSYAFFNTPLSVGADGGAPCA